MFRQMEVIFRIKVIYQSQSLYLNRKQMEQEVLTLHSDHSSVWDHVSSKRHIQYKLLVHYMITAICHHNGTAPKITPYKLVSPTATLKDSVRIGKLHDIVDGLVRDSEEQEFEVVSSHNVRISIKWSLSTKLCQSDNRNIAVRLSWVASILFNSGFKHMTPPH